VNEIERGTDTVYICVVREGLGSAIEAGTDTEYYCVGCEVLGT